MKKKIVLVLTVLLVMTNILGITSIFTTTASSDFLSKFPRTELAPDGLDPMDATPEMLGEDEIAMRKLAAQIGAAEATGASPIGDPATVGDELIITVSDMGLNIDYDETFVVVMIGTHGIILIEKAAYDAYNSGTNEYVFPNPNNCWRTEDRISTAQLSYLLDEFDNNIYPTDTSVFGEPLPRGEEGHKTWILIHNIRCESYYDCSQTVYVAGYFSSSEDAQNNKNMMHIDSYDWLNRIGPDVARPYLYEGVFAHEFQHLIHFDQDPDEPSWVDEACADLAGFLCDYGHPDSHLAYYFYFHETTSLTFWGGGLSDYGASYLFALFLYENYGGADFISALVQEQANGIEGIENTLDAFHHRDNFDDVFDYWTIANYLDLDSKEIKWGKWKWKLYDKYGYDSLEIGSEDTWGMTIEWVVNTYYEPPIDTPFEYPSDLYYGDPQPYTAHYFRFYSDKSAEVYIDGDDFSGTLPYSSAYEWYSDAEAWAWRSFNQTFDIPEGGATLNFYTFYDIEEEWDYGYVEVYNRSTGEWYTLDAPSTVDYVAHGQENANCPTGREPTDYETAGRWHAFTGYSGGWIPVSMDLSPFAGGTIDLYFTLWQDGAFTLQNMWVDDISIPEIGFFDDVEAGEAGWTSNGWWVSDGMFDNGHSVTIINTKGVNATRYPDLENKGKLLGVRHMQVDSATQSGTRKVPANPAESGRVQVAIVSNRANHILSSHYDFGVRFKEKKPWWWWWWH